MRFAQRFGFGASIFFFAATALLAVVSLIAIPVALIQGQFVHAFIALVACGLWCLLAWGDRKAMLTLHRRKADSS